MDTNSDNKEFWMYGPNGEAQIFTNIKDVPKGWEDSPAVFAQPEAKDDVVANVQTPDNTKAESIATVPAEASIETPTEEVLETPEVPANETPSKKKVK